MLSAKADTIRHNYLIASRRRAAQDGFMSASMPSPESMTFDRPLSAAGRKHWRPLVKGLLVYCTTVSISVAAAAALVSGVPADVLLASL